MVLDEADRMIDEGFEEPVNQILSAMGSELKAEEEEEQAKQAEEETSLTNEYRTTIMWAMGRGVKTGSLRRWRRRWSCWRRSTCGVRCR